MKNCYKKFSNFIGLFKSTLLTGSAFVLGFIFVSSPVYQRLFFAALFILYSSPILRAIIQDLKQGHYFNENLLMALACSASLLLHDYTEGLLLLFFYRLGEAFIDYAESKSHASLRALLALKPTQARIRQNDAWCLVPIETLQPGQVYQLRAGDRNSVDGCILSGSGILDTSILTGEATPISAGPGQTVLAGALLQQGILELQALKPAKDSSFQRILDLTQTAKQHKSRAEHFIRIFARIYTPIVLLLSVVTACVLALFCHYPWTEALHRTIALMAISCPCAVVISVPLSYLTAIGQASRLGMIFKGGEYIARFAHINHFVFDKTGTLTSGQCTVQSVLPYNTDEKALLTLAATAAQHSSHPLSSAILAYTRDRGILPQQAQNYQEFAGLGILCQYQGQLLVQGNRAWLEKNYIAVPTDLVTQQTVVLVGYAGQYRGFIGLADTLKPHSFALIQTLLKHGLRVSLLSGDAEAATKHVAEHLGIQQYEAQLLPEQKLNNLKKLMQHSNKKVAFVGDGINDLPAIAQADVGIAIGKGSESALEIADAVLLGDEPYNLYQTYKLCQKTQHVVWQNIVFSIVIKLIFVCLSIFGLSNITCAIFADTGASILAILNSLRLFRFPSKSYVTKASATTKS